MAQPNWKPPIQKFLAWIARPRAAHNGDESTRLEDCIFAGEAKEYLRQPGCLSNILAALFDKEEDRPDRGKILNGYATVFAILIAIDRGRYIGNFLVHYTLGDAKLPFLAQSSEFPHDHSGATDDKSLFERFQEAQWRFCAPVLQRGDEMVFPDRAPMPYTEKELAGTGGSAQVFKVKLHSEHDRIHKSKKQARATTFQDGGSRMRTDDL